MKQNSLLGRFVTLILFILASPFILVLFGLFFVIYFIFFIFEAIPYFTSRYYKILNIKYSSLVTLSKDYKYFNEITKKSVLNFKDNTYSVYYNNQYTVVLWNTELTSNNNKLIFNEIEIFEYLRSINNINNDLILVLNKKLIMDKEFKNSYLLQDLIIYEN